jgi:poly-gamma-glutamate synthesis protein (capsule biosynthesis protein)
VVQARSLGVLTLSVAGVFAFAAFREAPRRAAPASSVLASAHSAVQESSAQRQAAPSPPPARPVAERRPLTLIFGGDVSFGRATGQRLLLDPSANPLSPLRPLLGTAELRFANLESPLSDQNGQTQHPTEPLTFTGPPAGARALADAAFDIVSIANNHIWDYGRAAYLETLGHLEAREIAYTGGGKPGADPVSPTVITRNGWSTAWFGMTAFWNAGYIEADAVKLVNFRNQPALLESIERARAEHDLVIVSYHGGKEYAERISREQRAFAEAAMQAGADLVIGHHPHVPQGVSWHDARPAFYSLGNLLFERHRDHPWTSRGFLARVRFASTRPRAPEKVELCPYLVVNGQPRPLSEAPAPEELAPFVRYLRRILANAGATHLGSTAEYGCIGIEPATRQ